MRNEEKKVNDKGFSLVELIVVIAIMVALVAVVAVAVTRYVPQSRRSADISSANAVATAVQALATDEAVAGGSTSGVVIGKWTQAKAGASYLSTLQSDPVVQSLANGHFYYYYTEQDGVKVVVSTAPPTDTTVKRSDTCSGDLCNPNVSTAFKAKGYAAPVAGDADM